MRNGCIVQLAKHFSFGVVYIIIHGLTFAVNGNDTAEWVVDSLEATLEQPISRLVEVVSLVKNMYQY